MNILSLSEIDMNNLSFSNPKQNALGGQSISVSTNENKKLIFQSPKCLAYNGVSVCSFSNSTKSSCYIDIFANSNTNPMITFINQISLFDENIKKNAAANSSSWFKKHLDFETIQKLYKPSLKEHEISKYMRLKMPTNKDNEFLGDIFDKNKHHSSLDYIVPNSIVQVIIECTGIYFIPKEFGVTWKVIQIKVNPPFLSNYAFIDDNDSDDAEPLI